MKPAPSLTIKAASWEAASSEAASSEAACWELHTHAHNRYKGLLRKEILFGTNLAKRGFSGNTPGLNGWRAATQQGIAPICDLGPTKSAVGSSGPGLTPPRLSGSSLCGGLKFSIGLYGHVIVTRRRAERGPTHQFSSTPRRSSSRYKNMSFPSMETFEPPYSGSNTQSPDLTERGTVEPSAARPPGPTATTVP